MAIGFVPDSYTVNENEGSVTLTVRVISGILDRDVEVIIFSTQNDQALGKDYSICTYDCLAAAQ